MNHEMRRKDRVLEEEGTMELLKKEEYGILSTVGSDGYSYGVPLNYIYKDQAIYFHCAANVGHKLENIAHNNKVCFTVVGKTQVLESQFAMKYESAIVFGEAVEVQGDEKLESLKGFIEKYSSEFMESGMKYIQAAIDKVAIYKITIQSMSGKARR